jgi:hypothetical protein
VPAALIKMTVAERERYVRWWIEESGLTLVELRDVAGSVWYELAEQGSNDGELDATSRPER